MHSFLGEIENYNVELADTLLDRVAGIISRYNMLSPGDRVGVAVSGGVDSVTLLHLLSQLSDRFPLHISVLHANHQLRQEESLADEVFVSALAGSLQLPIEVRRLNLRESGNLEQQARLARQRFFQESMERHSLKRVALGHSRSDQAETVLFRILRGSGLAGLSGMRMLTAEGLIRPLLTTSRAEIRQWAEEKGISWREDSSNRDLRFQRNRLRIQMLPALTAHYNSNLEGVLASTAEVAQAEEDYWAERIEPIYVRITKRSAYGAANANMASFLQISDLAKLHLAEQRRVIRRALREVRGDLRSIDINHVDGVLKICQSGHGHDRILVPGVDALRSFGTLRLISVEASKAEERHYRIPVKLGRWETLPFGAGRIAVNWGDCELENCVNFKKAENLLPATTELDGELQSASELERLLHIRNWQPGDEIQLPGQAAKKLKFLFQEHRVLLWERKHWPVVALGDRIIWTRQFGYAAKSQDSGENLNAVRVYYYAEQ